jgi:hypothetical protein
MKMNRPRFANLQTMLAGKRATTERERWDALWASPDHPEFLRRCYAEGLNDNHIDTALRRHFNR